MISLAVAEANYFIRTKYLITSLRVYFQTSFLLALSWHSSKAETAFFLCKYLLADVEIQWEEENGNKSID